MDNSSSSAASSENYGVTGKSSVVSDEIDIPGMYENCTCEYTFKTNPFCKRHNGSGLKKMQILSLKGEGGTHG